MRSIGPRKLFRSIVTAQDLATPGPSDLSALQSDGSVSSTPLVFREYSGHRKHSMSEDDYFSRNGGVLAASKCESGSDHEQQGSSGLENTPRRPQDRPRISRRTVSTASHFRQLASPFSVNEPPVAEAVTSPEPDGDDVVDGSTVLLVEGMDSAPDI